MRVHVDRERCEGHGQCALAAPGVFRLDASLEVEYDEHPGEEHRDDVEEAVRMCPMEAIELTG